MGGDRKSGLNVIVERATHPDDLVQTIIHDIGSENVLYRESNKKQDALSCFYEPWHNWVQGSIEQVNGLIRRFYPKGTDFGTLSSIAINSVEKLPNNRPRKCFNYKTPCEAFRQGQWCACRLNVATDQDRT